MVESWSKITKRKRIATKRTNGRNLEEAVVLLINNQAAFVRDMGEIRKDMDEIRKELAEIKGLLRIHQDILSGLPEAIRRLPEAVRDKIGFNPRA